MGLLRTAVLAGIMACLCVQPVSAQDSWFKRFELRAILRSELAIGLQDEALQKADFVFEPELSGDLGKLGFLTIIGRLRSDPADNIEPGKPVEQSAVRSVVSRRAFIGEATDLELREAYLDSYIGDVFVRLGKQQVVWGKADGLRVLDIVNPFHLREFILPEFEDRRIPLWTAAVEVPIGPLQAQVIWVPDHSYDDLPQNDGVFAIRSARFVPQPPPFVVGDGSVSVEAADRPDRFIEDDDYGIRLTGFLGGWDFSVNYLFHYQDQAVPFREEPSGGGIRFSPRYERTHVVGGTFSNAFGPVTIRGEAAYSTDRFFITNDENDRDGVFQTGELGYVLGLDYQVDADLFLSAQLFQSVLTRKSVGAVRDRVDTVMTLLVDKDFQNDTIEAKALFIQSLNDGDGQMELDLIYHWRSNTILKIGADIFYGDRDGVFGQFDRADRLRLGIEYGF